jgi:hypothetical protein
MKKTGPSSTGVGIPRSGLAASVAMSAFRTCRGFVHPDEVILAEQMTTRGERFSGFSCPAM